MMIWAGNVSHMGEKKNAYEDLVEKPEDIAIDKKIILKCILEN
jgi:hypothetical protein